MAEIAQTAKRVECLMRTDASATYFHARRSMELAVTMRKKPTQRRLFCA